MRIASGLVVALLAISALAAEVPTITRETCGPMGDALSYIQALIEDWNPKNVGLEITLLGACDEVAGKATERLSGHRFIRVELGYFHWTGPNPINLLLAQTPDGKRTTGHIWEIWFADEGLISTRSCPLTRKCKMKAIESRPILCGSATYGGC